MTTRIARHRGVETVIGIDLVPERLQRARANGVQTVDLAAHGKDLLDIVRGLTGGRGPDAVIDAVGKEAHGSPIGRLAHQLTALLPGEIAANVMTTAGIDRLAALHTAIELVRRGGTISLSGVYGGTASPMPLLTMFDKQIQLRMGQANVHRWVPDILPLLTDGDPLGSAGFATHHLPLEAGPEAYRTFQHKQDGMVKTLLQPELG
jgi:threonine dehydrogenase-like Zn-dependent dehydrogenase